MAKVQKTVIILVVILFTSVGKCRAWWISNSNIHRWSSPLHMSQKRENKVITTPDSELFSKSPPQIKKKKKNKYAKFSKVEQSTTEDGPNDPLEALIRESEAKLRELQKEKEKASKPAIKPITPDADKRLDFPNNKDIDPYDPASFGYVEIGTVLGPHGVHGWNKVQGSTDFPERLTTPGMVLHFKPFRKRAPRKVLLANGKWSGSDSFLIQLEDINNRRQAEKLKGGILYYATQQDHVKKEEDLLLSDLVGLAVFLQESDGNNDEHSTMVGTVGAIVLAEEMCAVPGLGQDMLEIIIEPREHEAAQIGTPKDLVLIPMVPEIVTKVDLDMKKLWIDPPDGLLNLTYIREEKVRIKGLLPPARN